MRFGNMHVSSRLPVPIGLLGATMHILMALVSVESHGRCEEIDGGVRVFAFEMVWMPVREQFAYIAPTEILEPDRKT